MPVLRSQSLRDILYLQDRMNKVFDESMKTVAEHPGPCEWIPNADVFEDDKAITVKIELPGIPKEEIMIDASPAMLSISGNKVRPHDGRIECYHNIERQYGSFRRSFSLPAFIDSDKITARFDCGVLEIIMPKIKAGLTRKVSITRE